jgi:hypothetical protein
MFILLFKLDIIWTIYRFLKYIYVDLLNWEVRCAIILVIWWELVLLAYWKGSVSGCWLVSLIELKNKLFYASFTIYHNDNSIANSYILYNFYQPCFPLTHFHQIF